MTPLVDPLIQLTRSDRLHYATGELLGADDFQAEQTYHRRQLARAIQHLYGPGTVAGLRITNRHIPGVNGAPDEVELEVAPGIAFDRIGRIIEVPRPACIRLGRWFDFIATHPLDNLEYDAADLRAAWRNTGGGIVVADVFLSFHACDRGLTPAFASGPFDALDASQPSRVRDAYELQLVLRSEANPPSASHHYDTIVGGTPATRQAAVETLIFNAYTGLAVPAEADPVNPFLENPPGYDPTGVLLGRLNLPAAQAPNPNAAPVPNFAAAMWLNNTSNIDNNLRRFVIPPAALARLTGPLQ